MQPTACGYILVDYHKWITVQIPIIITSSWQASSAPTPFAELACSSAETNTTDGTCTKTNHFTTGSYLQHVHILTAIVAQALPPLTAQRQMNGTVGARFARSPLGLRLLLRPVVVAHHRYAAVVPTGRTAHHLHVGVEHKVVLVAIDGLLFLALRVAAGEVATLVPVTNRPIVDVLGHVMCRQDEDVLADGGELPYAVVLLGFL